MTKVKPKKRVFKAWAVVRNNGKILLGFDGLPVMCVTQSEAKHFFRRRNKSSMFKRVTIIVED